MRYDDIILGKNAFIAVSDEERDKNIAKSTRFLASFGNRYIPVNKPQPKLPSRHCCCCGDLLPEGYTYLGCERCRAYRKSSQRHG
jgi:hypothetical protein